MCLTLNSATVWTGSMFQVLVAVCGVASVLIGVSFLSVGIRFVQTIIVATNLMVKKIKPPGSGKPVKARSSCADPSARGVLTVYGGRSGSARRAGPAPLDPAA